MEAERDDGNGLSSEQYSRGPGYRREGKSFGELCSQVSFGEISCHPPVSNALGI